MVGHLKSYGTPCNIDMDETTTSFSKWNSKFKIFFTKVKNVKKNLSLFWTNDLQIIDAYIDIFI